MLGEEKGHNENEDKVEDESHGFGRRPAVEGAVSLSRESCKPIV